MEQRNQAVTMRFAENLVGAMLQRSGVDFFQPERAQHTGADFVIRNGDGLVGIEVKYTADRQRVSELWSAWWTSRMAAADSRKRKASMTPAPSLHLVIVSGTGDSVFTDAETAPLLANDQRTALSILPPPPVQTRAPIRRIK